jgi:hypothetical protein
MRSPRYPHRAGTLAAGLLVVVGSALSIGAPRAEAAVGVSWQSYRLLARAAAIHVRPVEPAAPLALDDGTVADGGVLDSQAAIDSLGTSNARASAAYPGDGPISLLGLAATIAASKLPPQAPPLPTPTFPAQATSSFPTADHATMSAGVAAAIADSSAHQSTAEATAGAPLPAAQAIGRAEYANGALTADAITELNAVQIGPLVIGHLRTEATDRRRPDGTRDTTATLDATAVTLNGQPVSIGPAASLNLGTVSIRYLTPTVSATTVTAPGLQVRLTAPASFAGPSQSTSLEVTLGLATVEANAEPGPAAELGDPDPITPTPPTTLPSPSATPTVSAYVLPPAQRATFDALPDPSPVAQAAKPKVITHPVNHRWPGAITGLIVALAVLAVAAAGGLFRHRRRRGLA